MAEEGVFLSNVLFVKPASDIVDAFSLAKAANPAVTVDGFRTDEVVFRSGNPGASIKPPPTFEREAENFVSDSPKLLFAAEYVLEDVFMGSLVVWKKYRDSTHYEVFKKNNFVSGPSFERILFLDRRNLEEETKEFIPYVRDVLGFRDLNFDDIIIILDHKVKKDRVYEYKVQAARVPLKASEVDFDLVMRSKGLVTEAILDNIDDSTLFTFSKSVLGSRGLAWIIVLSNNFHAYFGKAALTLPLSKLLPGAFFNDSGQALLKVPKSLNEVMCIISESVALFGFRETFKYILSNEVLAGLPNSFVSVFLNSIDEANQTFSYDRFKELIVGTVPTLAPTLNVSESGDAAALEELSSLNIEVPNDTGNIDLVSIEGLSKVFGFVNNMYLVSIYSQDPAVAEQISKIKFENKAREETLGSETLDTAVTETISPVSDQVDVATSIAADFLNIVSSDVFTSTEAKQEQKDVIIQRTTDPVLTEAQSAGLTKTTQTNITAFGGFFKIL
jgi:hypothetical protein